MECGHKSNCELFQLLNGNSALKIWQSYYCDGDYKSCKRYQSTLDGKKIPVNLMPNGKIIEIIDDMLLKDDE